MARDFDINLETLIKCAFGLIAIGLTVWTGRGDMVKLALSLVVVVPVVTIIAKSFYSIGATQYGTVRNRMGKSLPGDNPIGLNGEAGYTDEMLNPGIKFKLWPFKVVEKWPWIQTGPKDFAIAVAQVGENKPEGAKTAAYKDAFGNYTDVRTFIEQGGQKGIQRKTIGPNSTVKVHPIAFLVITKNQVYGRPIDPDLIAYEQAKGKLDLKAFGLEQGDLDLVTIEPRKEKILDDEGRPVLDDDDKPMYKYIDRVAVITTKDGPAQEADQIACRLGTIDEEPVTDRDNNPVLDAENNPVVKKVQNSFADIAKAEEQADAEIKKRTDELKEGQSKENEDLEAKHNKEIEDAVKIRDDELRVLDEYHATDKTGLTDQNKLLILAKGYEAQRQTVIARFDAFKARQEEEKKKLQQTHEAEKEAIIVDVDSKVANVVFSSQTAPHDNFQNFQRFLDLGGRMGLQWDVVKEATLALNPFCVGYDLVDMLEVKQGEVAVIKSSAGLPTQDISETDFKHGSLVRPGHRGVWRYALGTNKYPINPQIFEATIVSTKILTLNWAQASSIAHNLDENLSQITTKDSDGFELAMDVQVLIHIPASKAPIVIQAFGTLEYLVSEGLQPAVGNHFRNSMQAIATKTFVETRTFVQSTAEKAVKVKLDEYGIETKGVYIQDVILPTEVVQQLQAAKIADLETQALLRQKLMEDTRATMENSRGIASKQAELAESKVNIEIKDNDAVARTNEGRGEKQYLTQVGEAAGAPIESEGMARAKGFGEQVKHLGQDGAVRINVALAYARGNQAFVPEIFVAGNGGTDNGLSATLMKYFAANMGANQVAATKKENRPTVNTRENRPKDTLKTAGGIAAYSDVPTIPDNLYPEHRRSDTNTHHEDLAEAGKPYGEAAKKGGNKTDKNKKFEDETERY